MDFEADLGALERGAVGAGADVARVEVYDLLATMATVDELGSSAPLRVAAAKLEDEALTSIV